MERCFVCSQISLPLLFSLLLLESYFLFLSFTITFSLSPILSHPHSLSFLFLFPLILFISLVLSCSVCSLVKAFWIMVGVTKNQILTSGTLQDLCVCAQTQKDQTLWIENTHMKPRAELTHRNQLNRHKCVHNLYTHTHTHTLESFQHVAHTSSFVAMETSMIGNNPTYKSL